MSVQVVTRFVEEVLNRKNEQAIDELVSPDYRRIDSMNSEDGPDDIRNALRQRHSDYDNLRWDVVDSAQDGERVLVHLKASGRHNASGKYVQGSGSAVVTVRDGKIAEVLSVWDRSDF